MTSRTGRERDGEATDGDLAAGPAPAGPAPAGTAPAGTAPAGPARTMTGAVAPPGDRGAPDTPPDAAPEAGPGGAAEGGPGASGLSSVLARLRAAEAEAGRTPGGVRLIAVSKVQPEARVRAVLDAGHRLFGENRVQEAQSRWAPLAERYAGVELHLVGPLQTNKARAAAALFQAIHSVDRERLAEALARAAQERGAAPQVFVQVNTGAEPQKAGVMVEGLDALVARCRALDLPVAGLMGLPPQDEDPGPHFARLARLAEGLGLDGLSMGMSGDFERAVALGATHVRVGSAVFGAREPAP